MDSGLIIGHRMASWVSGLLLQLEQFEDTKGVIRIRISKNKTKQWPKEKEQKDKQRSTIMHIKLKIE